jgi:hypothetical protein
VAELDGWANHHTREAFEQDRARDAKAHGGRVSGPQVHAPPGAGRRTRHRVRA